MTKRIFTYRQNSIYRDISIQQPIIGASILKIVRKNHSLLGWSVENIDDCTEAVDRIAVLAIGLIRRITSRNRALTAVQAVPGDAPSILNIAGEACEDNCGLLTTLPLLQLRLMLTLAVLLSLKSLYTVNVPETKFSVLTMVQLPFSGSPFWQSVWLRV